jgi:hypothetical protein
MQITGEYMIIDTLCFIGFAFVVYYIFAGDTDEIQCRIELFFCGLGVNYKPSKFVCLGLAVIIFYFVYMVIFKR